METGWRLAIYGPTQPPRAGGYLTVYRPIGGLWSFSGLGQVLSRKTCCVLQPVEQLVAEAASSARVRAAGPGSMLSCLALRQLLTFLKLGRRSAPRRRGSTSICSAVARAFKRPGCASGAARPSGRRAFHQACGPAFREWGEQALDCPCPAGPNLTGGFCSIKARISCWIFRVSRSSNLQHLPPGRRAGLVAVCARTALGISSRKGAVHRLQIGPHLTRSPVSLALLGEGIIGSGSSRALRSFREGHWQKQASRRRASSWG